MNDMVNNPKHYASAAGNDIDCLTAMHAMAGDEEFAGHLRCQVFKYLWRYKKKGRSVEDLEKAKFYQELLIELAAKIARKEENASEVERLNVIAAMHEGSD